MKRTALLSVYDKNGIVEFAQELSALGFTLLASGGTARTIAEAGIPVRDVATIVGEPILNHRVVTLSREVHAGLLARPEDRAELDRRGIPWIDLVCVDFYPLAEAIADSDATEDSVLECTDIGGPTMLRSAAKGGRWVICDVEDRARFLRCFRDHDEDPQRLMRYFRAKAECIVAEYCLRSARYHSGGAFDGLIGERTNLELKYGENPFSSARLYKTHEHPLGLHAFTQIAGGAPSWVNLTDIDRLTRTMTQIAETFSLNFTQIPFIAVAVKHGNACGAAVAADSSIALKKMIEGNTGLIFGGVVMTNFPLDEQGATVLRTHRMTEGKRLLDGVIAPNFSEGANAVLERANGKCRMFQNPALTELRTAGQVHHRTVLGGRFRQNGAPYVLNLNDPEMTRTGDVLTTAQRRNLALAFAVGSTSSSNTITLVKNELVIANAVGQQSRVIAARLALLLAEDGGHDPRGAVAYSDSFFPFPDGPELLARAGVSTIFASSGSVKDGVVRDVMNLYGVTFLQLPDARCRGFFHH